MTELLALALLAGLVTWRIASLLHTEDPFEWLRRWIGIENDDKGYPIIYPDSFTGKLFHCFWCLSLVVALPVGLASVFLADVRWAWLPVVWLASSTVAIWTEKQILRSHSRGRRDG